MSRPQIGFLVSGPKGFSLLQGVHERCDVQFVSSHPVKGLQVDAYADVRAFAATHGYPFLDRDALSPAVFERASLVFVAGWQYLIAGAVDTLVVFHDSLLPELRGFAPTVTALISGKPRIGVSAFRPVAAFDAGPIYAQSALDITYPIKIRDAYSALATRYTEAANRVLDAQATGQLHAKAQVETDATYSVWRGPEDYQIDWSWSAERIQRFVNAVGWPYDGARTTYAGEAITIDDVESIAEMNFEDRHPGKVWKIEHGMPEIICGSGMIRIRSARTRTGTPVVFSRVRETLGAISAR